MPSYMNLDTEEIALIAAAVETQAQEVLERFVEIRARFGDSSEFAEEMDHIACQTGSSHEHRYGGICPDRDVFRLAGGIEGSLLSNIFYHLGLRSDSDLPVDIVRKASHAVVVRHAMARDQDLDLFIRSMIAGALKHTEIHGVRLRLDTEMVQMLGI
jgi:hypothetical protein